MTDYKQITESDGEILVKTARKVVTEYLTTHKKLKLDDNIQTAYSYESGVFVTINDPSGLRGCIGYPLPDKKLFNALTDAAISAATEDPRFPPVKLSEIDKIIFEVSVLTPPIEIQVEDPLDYPKKIKVGKDGLIIKAGFNSGLLLPQVPIEYGWTEEQFLSHTCEKAGLSRDFWKNKEAQVLKFEGIVFKEKTPNGKVVEVKL
ncbi:MAG: TIGR00296 family protein [Nitrosopumilaceae archaeon]|jgi:hypothetical protein|nr:MAG: hypothetical protein NPMRD1_270004 [Nitrosopumilales archaeon]